MDIVPQRRRSFVDDNRSVLWFEAGRYASGRRADDAMPPLGSGQRRHRTSRNAGAFLLGGDEPGTVGFHAGAAGGVGPAAGMVSGEHVRTFIMGSRDPVRIDGNASTKAGGVTGLAAGCT